MAKSKVTLKSSNGESFEMGEAVAVSFDGKSFEVGKVVTVQSQTVEGTSSQMAEQKVTLKSSDGDSFDVGEAVAVQSQIIVGTNSNMAEKTVMPKSSDGILFKVEEGVAVHSETFKHIIDDVCPDSVFTLANVNSEILARVIEFSFTELKFLGAITFFQ